MRSFPFTLTAGENPAPLSPGGRGKYREALAILLITLLAAALRFYRLPELPPGLHYDEGFKGVTARELLEGAPLRLFFEGDMGEEPIAIYLVAVALRLLGQEPWIIRLPSALIGTLTIPLAWWLGRELARQMRDPAVRGAGPQAGPERAGFAAQTVGLGTALVLAILYWHVSFSRIGMEPILVPFFAALAWAALLRGLNRSGCGKPSCAWFALAGLAVGGSLYTYKAGYFVPILAVLFILYSGIAERGFLQRHRRGLLLTTLVALLVATPLVTYFVTHPANFLQRPASVALGSGDGTSLLDNLLRVAGLFFVRGDANPRSNLPGRPALDPFLAILFLVGVGRALRGFRRPRLALPLLWLGVMALPTLLTGHAPHFGRAIGATPAVALLCGLGIERWISGIRYWGVGIGARAAMVVSVLTAGLAFSAFSTGRDYFVTWGRSPDLYYAYDVGLVEVAGRIHAVPADESVYLTPTSRDHYTLQFLVRRPIASFDGRAGLVFPPPGRAATAIVLLREDEATLPALQAARPDGAVAWTVADGYNRPYAAAYRLPASGSPAPSPDHPAEVIFGGAARLLGYSLEPAPVRAGNTVRLTLYWQVLAPLDKGYTVFTHLLAKTNGPVWAGHDSQPDGGYYPTTVWQPGEVILDVHPLSVPADAPPGEYRLEVGLYLLETMARLPATDAAGNHLADDAALLDIGDWRLDIEPQALDP